MNTPDYAKEYLEGAREVAKMIDSLKELRDHWEYLKERSGDNGDPYFDSEEALLKLRLLLSTLVIYQKEYEEDSTKENEKGNENDRNEDR